MRWSRFSLLTASLWLGSSAVFSVTGQADDEVHEGPTLASLDELQERSADAPPMGGDEVERTLSLDSELTTRARRLRVAAYVLAPLGAVWLGTGIAFFGDAFFGGLIGGTFTLMTGVTAGLCALAMNQTLQESVASFDGSVRRSHVILGWSLLAASVAVAPVPLFESASNHMAWLIPLPIVLFWSGLTFLLTGYQPRRIQRRLAGQRGGADVAIGLGSASFSYRW